MPTFDDQGREIPDPAQPYGNVPHQSPGSQYPGSQYPGPPNPAPPGRASSPVNLSAAVSELSVAGWGVLGAALLTFIFSFLPWYSVSINYLGVASGSASVSGWHRFWWIGVLLAVAVGGVYATTTLKILATQTATTMALAYGGVAAFVLTLISLIDTLTLGGSAPGISVGPDFGLYLALISTAALAYFGALAAQEAGATLPFTVPGPTRK